MPATAIPSDRGHQFALRFDRVCCRNCGADIEDAVMKCTGAKKIRPVAGIRQQRDEADRPPGYDVPPGSRIEAARRRAAAFFGKEPEERA